MRVSWLITWVFVLALMVSPASSDEQLRNPFGVKDVNDPYGEDVKQFAKKVTLTGGVNDKNAKQWVKKKTKGKPGSLDGDWSGR